MNKQSYRATFVAASLSLILAGPAAAGDAAPRKAEPTDAASRKADAADAAPRKAEASDAGRRADAAAEAPAKRSEAAGERTDGRRDRAARKGKEAMTSDEAIEQLSARIAEKLSAMKAAERVPADKRPAENSRLVVQNGARPGGRTAEPPARTRTHDTPRPGYEGKPTYQRTTYVDAASRPSNSDEAAAFAAAHRRANGAAISQAAGIATPAPRPAAPTPMAARSPMAAPGRDGHGSPDGTGPAAHALPHWSYDGESGPDNWARLHPEYARCSTGQRQSPIDIRDGFRVDLESIAFDYRPSAFRVIDNGHTVQVNLAPGSGLTVGGRRYELVQFHFHRPSEERVDGRRYDMVAHLVHKDAEGRLAVVAVLLERGTAQPAIQTVWNNLPLEQGEEVAAQVALDVGHLLPDDRTYFTYMGSLTTPPCTEGVLWMVLKHPVQVSEQQIALFSRLYPMNARPVQASAGRIIKESN